MTAYSQSRLDLLHHDSELPRKVSAIVFSIFLNLVVIAIIGKGLAAAPTKKEIIPIEFVTISTKQIAAPQPAVHAPVPVPKQEVPIPVKKEVSNVVKESKKKVAAPEAPPPPRNEPVVNESASDSSNDFATPGVEAIAFDQVNPEIPTELRTSEYKAYVRVKVEVLGDGSSTPTLKTSSGNTEIDSRVLAALKKMEVETRTDRWQASC